MTSSIATKSWLPSSVVVWTMRLLCLTALSISGYLAWTSFQTGEVFGCSGGQLINCDHVLHSKYAKVMGIPVSVPAFALYATLLSVLCFFRKSTPEGLLKAGWIALTIGAISAAGAAVWFTGLQIADWKFCPYCLGAHSCGLILATLVLLKNPLNWQSRTGFAGMALTGVLAMVAIQWQSEEPPTYTVETFPTSSGANLSAQGDTFDAPGEFAPPGSAVEEFAAPVAFNSPMEFAPPVFDPPGCDSPESASSDHDSDGAHGDTHAALVPPPVDITVDSSESNTGNVPLVNSVAVQTDQDDNLLPLEAAEDSTAVDVRRTVAATESGSRVEYTPPMEVPVIFTEGNVEIQRVDFRSTSEGDSAKNGEADTPAEDSTVAPATSEHGAAKDAAQQPVQTAVSEPTDLQVSHTPARPKGLTATSRKAMGYLFFSASGATNAAISEVLMLTTMLPVCDDGDEAAKAEEPPKKDKLVVVAGNRFSLNPKHWPLIGKPDADLIFVEMFDYTCPHCRVTNKAIEGAFKEYGDRLAVITLPVPLERACNSTVQGMGKPGACEMAKLAVAVWRIDRPKFADYHHYMCNAQRSVSAARAKAEELVGKDKLATELALPYATDYIKKHVELYRRVGQGSVPKLMFPGSTMTGEIRQASILVNVIKRELEK